jgi:hypothetical protein
MNRVTVIVAMISALCIGSALGFAGGVLFSHHALGSSPRFEGGGPRFARRGPPGEPSPRSIVPHLVRMLDLSPEQADAIRGEVEASRADFAQVRDSLHARIERHLTPAQRDRWREMVRERPRDAFHDPQGAPRGRDPRNFRAEPGDEREFSR